MTYIGNMGWRNGEAVRMGFDDAAAAAALKAYPNVHAAPVRATLTDATFRNGKDAFGLVRRAAALLRRRAAEAVAST